MPKSAYISNFFAQRNESESAQAIYDKLVEPRLQSQTTKAIKTFDSLFNADDKFSDQSAFLKEVRRIVINFERDVMSEKKSKPMFGSEEWEARIEEIVFLKSLCIECMMHNGKDEAKLKDFVFMLKDKGITAFFLNIFGSQYNGLIKNMSELTESIYDNKIKIKFYTEERLICRLKKNIEDQKLEISEKENQIRNNQKIIDDQGNQIKILEREMSSMKESISGLKVLVGKIISQQNPAYEEIIEDRVNIKISQ